MKVLWLSNVVLPGAAAALGLPAQVGGSWLVGQLEALEPWLAKGELELTVVTPHPKTDTIRRGEPAGGLRYLAVPGGKGGEEAAFRTLLADADYDLVHIFGTEYAHSHAMLRAAGPARTVVSIQGLVGFIAKHYTDGLPNRFRRRSPVKMAMKKLYAAGVVADEQRQFQQRGAEEAAMLAEARHVIGRTGWDKACLNLLNPSAAYHHCDEVLRQEFYTGEPWDHAACQKHSIFLSQAYYPVKGAHNLLAQLPAILKRWPDARVRIGGQLPYSLGVKGTQWAVDYFFEYQGYLKKLCRRLAIEDKIEWLGPLDAEGMKRAYLAANVFLNPSLIENSPNSLAEAMALGLPVVATAVGGVPSMLTHREEGLLYPRGEDYLLPALLEQVFERPVEAAEMGRRARARALLRHQPQGVTQSLLAIYREVAAP